jgi:hypothetical protein
MTGKNFSNQILIFMKNVALILLGIFLICCSESEDPKKVTADPAAKPSFTDFKFSSRFDMESTTADAFTNLNYYFVTGLTPTIVADPFNYSCSKDNGMPTGGHLTVLTEGSDLTLHAWGVMQLEGTAIADTYTGTAADWRPTCDYDITMKVNVSTGAVIASNIVMGNDFFTTDYDLKDVTEFRTWNTGTFPEWMVQTTVDSQLYKDFHRFVIVFTISDVYGTAFKK